MFVELSTGQMASSEKVRHMSKSFNVLFVRNFLPPTSVRSLLEFYSVDHQQTLSTFLQSQPTFFISFGKYKLSKRSD
jgi:hypothetical protein